MCALEFPELESRFHGRWGDDVVVWGVHGWEEIGVTDAQVLEFATDHGATFAVMRDVGGTYEQLRVPGATSAFPLDVVIDRDGIVRLVAAAWVPDELEAVIEGLLAE